MASILRTPDVDMHAFQSAQSEQAISRARSDACQSVDKWSGWRDRVSRSSFPSRGRYGQRSAVAIEGGRPMKQSNSIFAKLSNLSVKTRLIGVLGLLGLMLIAGTFVS